MVTEFTPISALIGGALIGLASAALLLLYGKIAGISGVVQGLFAPFKSQNSWKLAFVLGLISAGLLVSVVAPEWMQGELALPPWLIVLAGLAVGLGTTLGNGCTSGHGVCGMSRFSGRSWVATIVFMVVAIVVANAMSFITLA